MLAELARRDLVPAIWLPDPLVRAERERARSRLHLVRPRSSLATWTELAGIATRVSLADLVGEIARVSGLAAELAGSPNPEAEVALRHLAKLRDLAQGYQPIAGSLDLAGFVDYLDTLEESDQDEDELRAVEENAVKLMTLHRAKGLEWEVVFLPGLARGTMPNPGRGGNNPAEKWQRLPFELRGDREFLPDWPPTKADLDRLRDEEERRLMYVGITRARRRLVLSRAWFYRDNLRAKTPSICWDEAVETGLVAAREVDCPETNPYPLGIEAPEESERRFTPPPSDQAAIAQLETEISRFRASEARRPAVPLRRPPSTLSVTAFLTFVRDEEEFFWRYVRRVPSPPTPAAKLGIELHRRIELHSRGVAAVGGLTEETEEPYDLDVAERRGEPAVSAEQLWTNFERSRFARMKPLMTEQPFTLYIAHGVSVTGRIDAIFEHDDSTWEIVDYKTGASDPDPLQLAIYRRAVREIWGRQPKSVWLLLRNGEEQSPTNGDVTGLLNENALRLKELA